MENVQWFSLRARNEIVSELIEAYRSIQAIPDARLLDHACVYYRFDGIGDWLTLYFSPLASPLARQFGAIPCAKPDDDAREGFDLLLGVPQCLDFLHGVPPSTPFRGTGSKPAIDGP